MPGYPDSQPDNAALEALSIVAYEQPFTQADVRCIRGMDSDAVVETLMSRHLVADDPRFGGRGRPAFLVTNPTFLRTLGVWRWPSCHRGQRQTPKTGHGQARR